MSQRSPVQIPKPLRDDLRVVAALERTSISALVQDAIRGLLDARVAKDPTLANALDARKRMTR